MEIIDGRLKHAKHYDSPHCDQRPAQDISLLVVHNISLPPNQFNADSEQDYITDLFMGTLEPKSHPYFAEISHLRVSAHCLITRQGQVKQYVPFSARAWHAGNSCYQGRPRCNDYAIGIELEGTDYQPYTDAQYQALVELAIALMQHYPNIQIPSIVGHCDIAPNRKTDPGVAFDWCRFRQHLVEDS